MDMVRATAAEVFWETTKKAWIVRIQTGEEVVRRTCKDAKHDADDNALRSLAVQTAHDDGYDLAPAAVTVKR
jgi:hypothetical protein